MQPSSRPSRTKRAGHPSRAFQYADLFCGIGGFSQAAKQCGGELVAACDISPAVRRVFEHNYGITPHDDIQTMPAQPDAKMDLLCAGFPCQPFSRAGEKLGSKASNGRIFLALLRYAIESRVPCLLLENVMGLLSIEGGRTMREFLAKLHAAGYRTSHALLRSDHFGVPQLRKRLYLVAHRTRTFDFGPILEKATEGAAQPTPVLRPHLDPDRTACRALAFDTPIVLPPRRAPSGMLRCDDPPSADQTRRIYHPDGPIATMISSNPTKIYDPRPDMQIVRKLTAREMLACQGFDARHFQFPPGLSHSTQAHMCGNAVSPPVVLAILREMQRQKLIPSA